MEIKKEGISIPPELAEKAEAAIQKVLETEPDLKGAKAYFGKSYPSWLNGVATARMHQGDPSLTGRYGTEALIQAVDASLPEEL